MKTKEKRETTVISARITLKDFEKLNELKEKLDVSKTKLVSWGIRLLYKQVSKREKLDYMGE